MKKNHELLNVDCLNCGEAAKGDFCQNCGQSIRDNSDRSMARLFGEFFGNIFFLDNRILLSAKYLIRFPGRMTVEFLEGKRKKFISPITLFLFVNLIYFFVNPLSDYSLALYDQVFSQVYSGEWTKDWVRLKMQAKDIDFSAYAVIYQKMSDNISKSIMIINVPMIAIFVYLMSLKKRKFYFDSLIFSFHFFSLYMASWGSLYYANSFIDIFTSNDESIAFTISSSLFAFVIPLIYAILAVKKFISMRWYWAILAGLGVIAAVTLANVVYRFIILVLTLSAT